MGYSFVSLISSKEVFLTLKKKKKTNKKKNKKNFQRYIGYITGNWSTRTLVSSYLSQLVPIFGQLVPVFWSTRTSQVNSYLVWSTRT